MPTIERTLRTLDRPRHNVRHTWSDLLVAPGAAIRLGRALADDLMHDVIDAGMVVTQALGGLPPPRLLATQT